ncbi:MAG TPA: MarR family transcriptional regulator, partial [Candidatus Limnocylindrales bacterium]
SNAAPADASHYVGFQVKALQQILRTVMDAALRGTPVSTSQYAVLATLRDAPGASGAAIAARTFMSPQSLNEAVAGLERRGLVTRAPHPTHGRIVVSGLTPVGDVALREADEIVARIEEQMLQGLSQLEREAFAGMLETCRVALSLGLPTETGGGMDQG